MWKRLSVVGMAVKGDAKRLWFALEHPDAPPWLKAGVAAMALYLISPIDLIPDVWPVIGVIDDLIILPLATRWLLARLPPHIRQYANERSQGGSGMRRATHPNAGARGKSARR
jgi:uncharacterized membrane protein YkvA (DUF1232 family)